MLEMCYLNSYIIYKKMSGSNIPYINFKLEVIKMTIIKYRPTNIPRKYVQPTTPDYKRLNINLGHYPQLIGNCKTKKGNIKSLHRRCMFCFKTGRNIRENTTCQMSRFQCTVCKTPLCVDYCFEQYHTLQILTPSEYVSQ